MEKYLGLSYEQLSRRGGEIIEKAAKSGEWHSVVEDLVYIKRLMLALSQS